MHVSLRWELGKINSARSSPKADLGKLFFLLLDASLLALFHSIRLLSYLLPPSSLYAIFDSLGSALFYARPRMRHRLLKVIRTALPEIDNGREVSRLARGACAAALLPMLDLIILKRHGEKIMRSLQIEGIENLEKADSGGKGVIVITSHLGAFSIGTAIMARIGKPVTPIGFHPEKTMVPRYLETLMLYAKSLGCDDEDPIFFVRQDIIQRVLEHLGREKRVGIAYDVMGDHVVEFFGRPTALVSGIAHFAYNTQCPIVPTCLLRGDKPLQFRLIIDRPLTHENGTERSQDVEAIMGGLVKAGERLIREAPDQWMGWFGLTMWQDKANKIRDRQRQDAEKTHRP